MAKSSCHTEEITPEHVVDLTEAVISLTEQVRVLRQAVDEIGDELGWAIKNRVVYVEPIEQTARRITSFPFDPAADDFHERVSQLSAKDLHSDERPFLSTRIEPQLVSPRTRQERLW